MSSAGGGTEGADLTLIAIDGPAGSGKSTVARALARRLALDYLDTGAMYRAVAFAALQKGIDPGDREHVAELARQLSIDVGDQVLVDGADATTEIRGPEVTRTVSIVAANPEVRVELRDRQRAWARAHGGGVIEGRDIGTVVFPGARFKVYLTAPDGERARRRYKETAEQLPDASSQGLALETVQADLARRDHLDSTRATSPLAVADDAVILDTGGRDVDSIVDELLRLLPTSALHRPAASIAAAPSGQGGVPAAAVFSEADRPARSTESHHVWTERAKGPVGQQFDRALYRFLRALVLVFARVFWRLTIDGAERLPPSGAYVVAPVHRSNIDTPLVGCITTRRMRFMGKDSLWRNRLSARFFYALGGFPVVRGTADRDALRRCIEVVESGEPLVLFPEGTRQSGPLVEDLYEGAAYVATRTGVPIVPVGIGGSERAMPRGARGLRPGRIAIIVGTPLVPEVAEGRRRGSRRAVRELTAQLHVELQTLLDAARLRAGD